MQPFEHAWAILKAIGSPSPVAGPAEISTEVAEMLREAEDKKRVELMSRSADYTRPEGVAEAKRMLRDMDPEGPQY